MMRRFRNVLAAVASLLGLAGADSLAPPAIAPGGIVNAASRLPASLRGGAIARGARFTIPGVRLGPDLGVHGSESAPPVSRRIELNLTRKTYGSGLVLLRTLELPANAVKLRVLVWNDPSGEIGTLTMPMTDVAAN